MNIKSRVEYIGMALISSYLYFADPLYSQSTYQELASQTKKVATQSIESKVKQYEQLNSGLEAFVVERIKDGRLTLKENYEIRDYIERKSGIAAAINSESQKFGLQAPELKDNSCERELYNSLQKAARHNKEDKDVKNYFKKKGVTLDSVETPIPNDVASNIALFIVCMGVLSIYFLGRGVAFIYRTVKNPTRDNF